MGEYVEYIVIALAALILLCPILAWRIHKMHRFSKSVKDFSSKPFVCPNCGHRFHPKKRIVIAVGEDKAYIKCPACKKRDFCQRPYDFDENRS